MKIPRKLAVGLLLAGIALAAAACGGIQNPEGWASPAIDGPTAYYFPNKSHLSAITLDGPRPAPVLWTFPDSKAHPEEKDVSFSAVYGNPLVVGNTVYVVDYSKGHIYGVDKTNGGLASQFTNIKGGVVGNPVLVGTDKIAFGTTDSRVYLLNLDLTPAPGWPTSGVTVGGPVWASLAASPDGSAIYVATMTGELSALRATDGSVMPWAHSFKVDGAIPDLTLLDAGRLFVPSLNHHVYIVNPADGSVLNGPDGFTASDWVWTHPAFQDNKVYFGDFSGKVYGLDITKSGQDQQLWVYDAKNKVKSGPAIVDNILVVADRKPQLHFISLTDGSGQGVFPITGAGTIRADITPHGDKPLVATTNGKLFEVDVQTKTALEVPIGGKQ